jgi:hypothetical protein
MSHANGNWNGRKTLFGKTKEVGEKAKIRVKLGAAASVGGKVGKEGEKRAMIRLDCAHMMPVSDVRVGAC